MNEVRQSIITACRGAWERGLLSGAVGNASIRSSGADGRETVFITCSGAAKGHLLPGDIVALENTSSAPLCRDTSSALLPEDIVAPEKASSVPLCRQTRKASLLRQEWTLPVHDWSKKRRLRQPLADEGRLRMPTAVLTKYHGKAGRCRDTEGAVPSSELDMHLALYRARPDARAIAHTHPGRLLALSLRVAEEDFLRLPLFEAKKLRAALAFVPALPPGTRELALAAAGAAGRAEIRALWLHGHGLVCLGASLVQAFALAEELEHLALVQLFGQRL